jgi:hypothetical protein
MRRPAFKPTHEIVIRRIHDRSHVKVIHVMLVDRHLFQREEWSLRIAAPTFSLDDRGGVLAHGREPVGVRYYTTEIRSAP